VANRNLLVVDDSKVMREMVIACLRGEPGLQFSQASSGLEAIEKLSLSPFELVILDLNMPDINGVEVVEFVRAQEHLQSLPILIVTTRGDDTSRDRVLSAGATQLMTKPFTPDGLIGAVRALLDGRTAASPPA
jgi:two-component system, chemotaxis family, chemotaxis protein CheY